MNVRVASLTAPAPWRLWRRERAGVAVEKAEARPRVVTLRPSGRRTGYYVGLYVVVGLLSISRSRRWQTGIAAFLLLIPTVLTGVTQYAAVGAREAVVTPPGDHGILAGLVDHFRSLPRA